MSVTVQNKRCRILLSETAFKDEFLELESWLKSDSKWVFRGHASTNWKLTNTLERQYKLLCQNSFNEESKCDGNEDNLRKYLSESDDYITDKLEAIEKRLITSFKKSIGEDCSQDPSLVKYMALMQHYGIPSRLLDFSRSPAIALFFAMCKQGEKDRDTRRVVWAVNTRPIEAWVEPYKNELLKQKVCNEVEVETVLADKLIQDAVTGTQTSLTCRWYPIYMEGNNLRMIAQKGLFMMPLRLGHMEQDFAATLGYDYNHEVDCISYTDFKAMSVEETSSLVVISMEFPISSDGRAWSILADKGISREKLLPDLSLMGWLKDEIL